MGVARRGGSRRQFYNAQSNVYISAELEVEYRQNGR
jgi:hypothetical protein